MTTITIDTDNERQYAFDFDAHTVTPLAEEPGIETLAAAYQALLDDGTAAPRLIGPQIDDYVGLNNSWKGDPRNAVAIILHLGAEQPVDYTLDPPPEET